MTYVSAAASDKVVLNFYWIGPTTHLGSSDSTIKTIDLVFQGAKTQISVTIPEDIATNRLQKLSFTCRKTEPVVSKKRTASLCVTVEQVRNLTLNGGVFGNIGLENKAELKAGQPYDLIVSSEKMPLSAHIVSAELLKKEATTAKVFRDAAEYMFQISRFKGDAQGEKLGEKLKTKAMQLAESSLRGELGDLNPRATDADLFSYGIKEVLRMAQEAGFPVLIPDEKPSKTPTDLDRLDLEALKSEFENELKYKKEIERQINAAAIRGDSKKINQLFSVQHINIQSIANIQHALSRRGVSVHHSF